MIRFTGGGAWSSTSPELDVAPKKNFYKRLPQQCQDSPQYAVQQIQGFPQHAGRKTQVLASHFRVLVPGHLRLRQSQAIAGGGSNMQVA
jgi:hypothetical protein